MRSMNKKEYNKKYYKEHRNERLAHKKLYREAHRDEILASMRQYYKEHRDEKLASVKQYYKEHRDGISAYKKQWYEQNKEKEKQRVKIWVENHREQRRESEKKNKSKRKRGLDFVPLNKPFKGSEAHHICATFVIYIPKDMHRSIKHSVLRWKNMEEINKLAWEELYKQRATDTLGCI